MALQFPTRAERPGSQPHAAGLRAGLWPGFMYHDPVQNRYFRQVIEDYAEFHFYAWDDEREEVVGGGNAIPAAWDRNAASLPARGISAIVEAAFAAGAHAPNVLCALQIVIDPEYRGRGLSRRMIDRMREIGGEHGLDTLIAPVRPSLKHRYPLAPMDRYITWRRPDGTLLDPWLRTHERLGAEIVKIAPESLRIRARSPNGRNGRRWHFQRAGPMSCPGRSFRSRSTASGTRGSTSSRTSGWCTPRRGEESQ